MTSARHVMAILNKCGTNVGTGCDVRQCVQFAPHFLGCLCFYFSQHASLIVQCCLSSGPVLYAPVLFWSLGTERQVVRFSSLARSVCCRACCMLVFQSCLHVFRPSANAATAALWSVRNARGVACKDISFYLKNFYKCTTLPLSVDCFEPTDRHACQIIFTAVRCGETNSFRYQAPGLRSCGGKQGWQRDCGTAVPNRSEYWSPTLASAVPLMSASLAWVCRRLAVSKVGS